MDHHDHDSMHFNLTIEVGEKLSGHLGKLMDFLQGQPSREDRRLLGEALHDTAKLASRLKTLDASNP